MIFVTHIKNAKAAKDYYSQHLAPGDYYAKDSSEMKGVFHGKAANELGLQGEVSQADYFALCENKNPRTGKKLTPRTKEDRRVLTDFTFDAPKSVTLAFEMGGADGKGDGRILEAFRSSVKETMDDMEAQAKTRVRKGDADEDRVTGNMVWSEHVHRTTRPVDGKPDPHLHCHATVFNATYDQTEKRWKAIQLGDVVRDKGYYQAAFHARLASRLNELGYGIEKDGNSFRIAGVTKETTEKFSRRTELIEAEAEKLGITDAAEKGKLGRKTREKKSKEPDSLKALQKEWEGRLTDAERLSLRAANFSYGDERITADQAKDYAIAHAFKRSSTVPEQKLKAEALKYAVGSIRPEDVNDITLHPDIIAETREGQVLTTSKSVLRDEIDMLTTAKDGQRKFKPLIAGLKESRWKEIWSDQSSGSGSAKGEVDEKLALAERSLGGLSEEQRKAALHVLTSRDRVTGIVGKAGTGKTTMLRATVDAIHGGTNQKVYAFAPSSQASRGVLANEGFKDATTLETLLRSSQMQEKVKGNIILVDEAGLVSSRDMKRLMDVAKKGNSRVILSGDYTQHSSVEAGDAFRLMEKEAGVKMARLKEVKRQKTPGYKKAVEAISQGTGKAAQDGFDALNKMGCVIEASGEERHKLLIRDYVTAKEEGRSALIIAPTHAEGKALTEGLRNKLKSNKELGPEHSFITRTNTAWTNAEKSDKRNYESGMVVEFHKAVAGKRKMTNGFRSTEGGFAKGEAAVVREDGAGLYLLRTDGKRTALPTEKAEAFDVYRTGSTALAKGDRIRITKNGEAKLEGQAKGTRINNGDIYTVEGFTKEGDIRIDKGKLLPKNWGHMTYGYVDTSYASQGKTVDRVFIAAGKESLGASNQQQWYVSVTRGKEMAKVYVNDKWEIRNAIAKSGERLSAVELTQTKIHPTPTWRTRLQHTWERNRVRTYLRNRTDRSRPEVKEMESYG